VWLFNDQSRIIFYKVSKVLKDLKINVVLWHVLIGGAGREEGTVRKQEHRMTALMLTMEPETAGLKKVTVWGVPSAAELPLFSRLT